MARYRDLDKIDPFRCGFHVSVMRAKFLEWLPEEDVAPVVHAHWIKAFFPGSVECDLPILLDVTCSHCAFKMWELYPYCPNCGAKMDEEV